jgi:hypothetical protein
MLSVIDLVIRYKKYFNIVQKKIFIHMSWNFQHLFPPFPPHNNLKYTNLCRLAYKSIYLFVEFSFSVWISQLYNSECSTFRYNVYITQQHLCLWSNLFQLTINEIYIHAQINARCDWLIASLVCIMGGKLESYIELSLCISERVSVSE